MKNALLTILFFSLCGATMAQTTGIYNRMRVRDTLTLSGASLAEIVTTISAASKNNESPTAKAVYAYVQTILPNLIAGTGISITGTYPNKTITNDGVTSINGEIGDVVDVVFVTDPVGGTGGDVDGTLDEMTVVGIQGQPLTGDTPASGEVLKWNGTAWDPAADGGTSVSEPANQALVGTGSGITSDADFTYNPTTNSARILGNLSLRCPDTPGVLNILRPITDTKYGLYFGGTQTNFIKFKKEPGSVSSQLSDFNIVRGYFPSASSAGDNQVYSWGTNIDYGAGLEDPTQISVRFAIEQNYRNSLSDPRQAEIHIPEIKYPDGDTRRMISMIMSNDVSNKSGSTLFTTDLLDFYDYKTNSAKAVFRVASGVGAKGWDFLDTSRSAYYINNTPILQQRNAAGTQFYEIARLNGSDKVELSPQGVGLYTTANNFTFSNGMVLQPNSGQGVAIGSSGTSAGQFEVFSLFPLWMKNSTNTSGFSYVLNGALELRDMSTNDAVMTIENNTPVNTLYMASTGKIAINGATATRTLTVNGEARITDLTTDAPTKIVGADNDGDLAGIAVGAGLDLTAGTLSLTSGGSIYSLNGLTTATQTFATGTSGADFAISSSGSAHTFNLPTASAAARGLLSISDFNAFTAKLDGSGTSGRVALWNGAASLNSNAALLYNGTVMQMGNSSTINQLRIYNNESDTSPANTNNYDQVRLINGNTTAGNWTSMHSYTNGGSIGAGIGFKMLNHTTAESETHIFSRGPTNSFSAAGIFADNLITLVRPVTLSSTSTHTGAATFSSTSAFNGVATFNAAPSFLTPIVLGNSTTNSKLTVWNNYASTSPAATNDFDNIQLRNGNTTAGNWTSVSATTSGGNIGAALGFKMRDHTNAYCDVVFFTKGAVNGFIEAARFQDGKLGINVTSPTAAIHLPGGTTTANTAPLKFTSGTNLTTPEAGAVEWDGTNLSITQTTGPTRKTIAYTTDIPSADGNGIYSGSGSTPSGGSTVTVTDANKLIFTSTESSGNQVRFNMTQGSGIQYNNNSGTQLNRTYSTGSAFVNESATRQQTIQGATSVNLIATDGIKSGLFTVNENNYVTLPSYGTFPTVTGGNKTGWNSTNNRISYAVSGVEHSVADLQRDFVGTALSIRTADFTMGTTNVLSEIIDCNAGAVVVTLGDDLREGVDYVVKCRRNGTNTVTFNAGGSNVFEVDTISTLAPTTLVVGASGTGIEAPHKVYTIRRSGTNIFIQ